MSRLIRSYDEWEIELDEPVPAVPRIQIHRPRGETLWGNRLRPLVKYPGTPARIARDLETSRIALNMKSAIERSLKIYDDHESWTVNTRKVIDSERLVVSWGVWATYNGRMSESEYLALEHRRAQKRIDRQKTIMRNQARRAALIRRNGLGSLRPPTM